MHTTSEFNPKYMFLKGSTGKKVFFPWGKYGKGYLIENEETEKRIRRILIPYISYGSIPWFFGVILIYFLFKLPLNPFSAIFMGVSSTIFWGLGNFLIVKILTKDLVETKDKYIDLLVKLYVE